MGNIKQSNIKNRTYYFLNYMINIKHFDSNLLKIEKSEKNIGAYYIRYITIKKIDDYKTIYSVNPLHLIIGKVHGLSKKEMEVNI